MLHHVDVPVVFTGSQLPDYLLADPKAAQEIIKISKDVGIRANLINAIQIVHSKVEGIYIMFGDKLLKGKDVSLGEPLNTIPFEFGKEHVMGKVEFSFKLSSVGEEELKKQTGVPMKLFDELSDGIAYFEITENNIQIFLETLKIFGILSNNHKHDILQIINTMFA